MNKPGNHKGTITPQRKKELNKAINKAVKQYKKIFDLLAKT